MTGLLFVALSFNLHTIAKTPAYLARARETLGGMVSLLVLSLLILIPGQDFRILGGELMVGSIVLIILGTRLQFQTISRLDAGGRGRWALRLTILNSGTIAGLIAGISLIVRHFGGLFWLVPTILIYLLWALNNIWILMVQAAREKA